MDVVIVLLKLALGRGLRLRCSLLGRLMLGVAIV